MAIHQQSRSRKCAQSLDQAQSPHPRLLTGPAGLQAVRHSRNEDPLRRQLAATVIRQADLLLDVDPITRTLQGRRLLGQSRTCVQRVITLSMAFHLTEDPRYARRAEKEMLAAARFEDWNPSHFLDVAEMTFALAIGYDWLFDQLDDSARIEIGDAIIQKGVSLPFTTPHHGWVRSGNNWGQVCHGGLTAGALAVMERDPDLAARTVHQAVQNVTHSMAVFAPKGSYPEGPGYWAYGTGYNVLLISVLESALGTDFGLSQAPGFDQTGQYPNLVGGPSGAFFNYADGGAGRGPQPFLFWFADRFDRPDWLLGERERFQEGLSAMTRNPSASRGDRFLPLTLLWLTTAAEPTDIRMPLHWHSQGETPITVHRSSWTDPQATFVGFKGGSPSANHGQMDIGSFVLDADGVRWAMDLGAEDYHGIESRGMNLWNSAQDSDRWTIFRQSNHGHNTLVIDGKLQNAAAAGKFVSFSDDPEFPHSVLDLSEVYAGQAGSAHRGIALLPSREVLIQDHLTGLQPGSRVRWGMISSRAPRRPGRCPSAIEPGRCPIDHDHCVTRRCRLAGGGYRHATPRMGLAQSPHPDAGIRNRGACVRRVDPRRPGHPRQLRRIHEIATQPATIARVGTMGIALARGKSWQNLSPLPPHRMTRMRLIHSRRFPRLIRRCRVPELNQLTGSGPDDGPSGAMGNVNNIDTTPLPCHVPIYVAYATWNRDVLPRSGVAGWAKRISTVRVRCRESIRQVRFGLYSERARICNAAMKSPPHSVLGISLPNCSSAELSQRPQPTRISCSAPPPCWVVAPGVCRGIHCGGGALGLKGSPLISPGCRTFESPRGPHLPGQAGGALADTGDGP